VILGVHAYPFRSQIHPEPADNMIGWNRLMKKLDDLLEKL